MPGKITSLDVAEKAGVSRSAVSRVFTPGASVSDKTATKVRRAADELGYRPNVLARSLLTGKSRIIGLVVAYLDNHFYPEALEKLSTALQARGYHVLVFMGSAADPETIADEMLDYQVDGLILASVEMTSDLADRCRATGVPVVLFNRREERPGELAIVSDNYAGGRMIAQHFLDAGAKRIGHIAGLESASTQNDREAGFTDCLNEFGQTLYARQVGAYDPVRAEEAARAMFSGADYPDAVFVANDYMAIKVMDVVRSEIGLRVPGDVMIAGFDDVPIASWKSYDLTSVRQNADAMVAETVETLIAKIDGKPVEQPALIPVSLSIRGSSRRD
jgi:DNA-binding LacI/PurR family transcriptional regulator